MSSTYSSNYRFELIGTGDQQGSWGVTTNGTLGTLLENALGGYTSVAITDGSDTVLTTANGATDQARYKVLNLTGALTAQRNLIAPAVQTTYIVKNATTGGFGVVFKVSGQTGTTIPNGGIVQVYVDGTDVKLITVPISTGITGLGTGVAALLAANATGSGAPVGGTAPTISTPVLNGTPTGNGVATAATASTIALRDANGNLTAVDFISGFTSTVTAAGTTVLTVASNEVQVFTGSTTQTATLPTTGVVAGQPYTFINLSSGLVTIQSSGANTVVILGANTSAVLTALVATPTTAANWNAQYYGVVVASGKVLTANNSITLAGTDATTMTFPSTSSTVLTTGNTANMTAGMTTTPYSFGAVSSGTKTLDGTLGQCQVLLNAGAFTLAPPSTDTEIDLLVRNVSGAGAITISGAWRAGASTGSTFATTVRASATVTTPVASPGVVNWTAHGLVAGDAFYISGGVLPTGLTANTTYYVISAGLTANAFELATTVGGSAINFTGSSSGTQTGTAPSAFLFSARRIDGVSMYSWYQVA